LGDNEDKFKDWEIEEFDLLSDIRLMNIEARSLTLEEFYERYRKAPSSLEEKTPQNSKKRKLNESGDLSLSSNSSSSSGTSGEAPSSGVVAALSDPPQ
jgi:hypothetical protein